MRTSSNKSKLTIAVDIDGILTNETEGHDYENRTPNVNNIARVNNLFSQGHTIILFSSRLTQDYKVTIKWLTEHVVYFHGLILGKPQYDAIIDDKSFNNFEDFRDFTRNTK